MIKRILNFTSQDWKHLRFLFIDMIKQFLNLELKEVKDAYYCIKIHLSYDSKLVKKNKGDNK